MEFFDEEDDLDDLVDFLEVDKGSDTENNEQENNIPEFASDNSETGISPGIEPVKTSAVSKNTKLKTHKHKMTKDSVDLLMKSNLDAVDEHQSIEDELKATREKLANLEKQLAEKEHLKNQKIIKVTEKSNQVKPTPKVKDDDESFIVKKFDKKPEEPDVSFKKNERVAHTAKREPKMERSAIDNIQLEKKKLNIDKKRVQTPKSNKEEQQWETESYSGIRIITPRISRQQMQSRMEDRRFIKLHMLSRFVSKGEITGDWVTMGVVVKKFLPKTSANGKTFSIWKLSDLAVGNENSTISFFLFGDVYKEYWKMAEGNVIALLNAAIMPQRDNDEKGCVALTLDNPRKFMALGISKDFGHCQATTKTGNQCSFIVNKFHGEFCEHHISRQYKKIQSKRMEFQSASVGPDLNKAKHMKALKKEIQSGQLYYAGQAVTWTDKGASKKKAEVKKQTLSALMGPSSADGHAKQNACNRDKDPFEENGISEDFKARLQTPTIGSRNLMKFLQKDEEEKQVAAAEKVEVKSAKDLIKEEKKLIKQKKFKAVNLDLASLKPKLSKPPVFNSNFKPVIGGLHKEDDFIEFCDSDDIVSNSLNSRTSCNSPVGLSLKKTPLVSKQLKPNDAKLKAISLLRSEKIKINAEETDTDTKKKSPDSLQKIKDRVRKNTTDEESENREPSRKRRKGILDDALGAIEPEEGKRILETKSAHEDTVERAEAERQAAYFGVLEKKEMYEEKMKSIMEVKVKVVCCKICKYMHEFQSDFCKDKGHFTVRVDAAKRFFMCKNCKLRITSFKRLPAQPCSNCGSSNYERTSMYQERKGPKIGAETLLVRGEEHAKFINSLK